MKLSTIAAGFLALNGFAGIASGEVPGTSVDAAHPRTYALIAAVGENFTVISEVQTTGTHLPPYRRTTSKVPDNVLNRVALHGLDAAIEKIDPASKRIYLSLSAPSMGGVAPQQRGNVAAAHVMAALEPLKERVEWDRIVIAVPAYRALEQDRMASKLQGFGIFSEPLCQAGCGSFGRTDLRYLDDEPPDGFPAVNSKNEAIKARTFLAPFSYIEIWVVDPKTLAVTDRKQGFDHQKLGERKSDAALDVDAAATQRYLSTRIASLIELSIGEAVRRSEISTRRPHVEIGDIKIVEPDDAGK